MCSITIQPSVLGPASGQLKLGLTLRGASMGMSKDALEKGNLLASGLSVKKRFVVRIWSRFPSNLPHSGPGAPPLPQTRAAMKASDCTCQTHVRLIVVTGTASLDLSLGCCPSNVDTCVLSVGVAWKTQDMFRNQPPFPKKKKKIPGWSVP